MLLRSGRSWSHTPGHEQTLTTDGLLECQTEAAAQTANRGHGDVVAMVRCLESAARFKTHLHGLALDAVDRCGTEWTLAFVEAGTPND